LEPPFGAALFFCGLYSELPFLFHQDSNGEIRIAAATNQRVEITDVEFSRSKARVLGLQDTLVTVNNISIVDAIDQGAFLKNVFVITAREADETHVPNGLHGNHEHETLRAINLGQFGNVQSNSPD
jgi:hypothetical protein